MCGKVYSVLLMFTKRRHFHEKYLENLVGLRGGCGCGDYCGCGRGCYIWRQQR